MKRGESLITVRVENVANLFDKRFESLGAWEELTEAQQQFLCDWMMENLTQVVVQFDKDDAMDQAIAKKFIQREEEQDV